jgi:hypothetical protein
LLSIARRYHLRKSIPKKELNIRLQFLVKFTDMSAWKLVEAVEEVRQADTNSNGFSDKRGGRGGRGERLVVQIKNTKKSALVACKLLQV